ncbi:transcriptional regulator, Crp/Fnr family [Thermincola potens JR]|uniref:Transcriptional regulator, Crp/Fnr family n=2 Tax=Thermincola TaxID=278993 RepID=D5XDQ1_THEPJ|nr:transcriptional regulator, Crp/Fnr family [Thermincola potens JR]
MPTRMKLTNVNLLESLNSPEYEELRKAFLTKQFSRKEIISFPKEEPDKVYFVKSGRVRVYLAYEDKEFTLSILESGDIYSTHTRAFTQAMEDTTLFFVDTREFGEIVAKFPALALSMVKVLGDLLKNAITIINGLVFKDSQVRLAEFLVHAAQDKGEHSPEGIEVKLGLTTEEIAMVLGITRQTVSTLFNDLIKSGIIKKLDRKTILIKDISFLKELSTKS